MSQVSIGQCQSQSSIGQCQFQFSFFVFFGLLLRLKSQVIDYVSLSVSKLRSLERGGGCLSSAKLRSTDSVNPRAVLSRVRPRYTDTGMSSGRIAGD